MDNQQPNDSGEPGSSKDPNDPRNKLKSKVTASTSNTSISSTGSANSSGSSNGSASSASSNNSCGGLAPLNLAMVRQSDQVPLDDDSANNWMYDISTSTENTNNSSTNNTINSTINHIIDRLDQQSNEAVDYSALIQSNVEPDINVQPGTSGTHSICPASPDPNSSEPSPPKKRRSNEMTDL